MNGTKNTSKLVEKKVDFDLYSYYPIAIILEIKIIICMS